MPVGVGLKCAGGLDHCKVFTGARHELQADGKTGVGEAAGKREGW